MAYKTDGSSHSDGIKNEENLIEKLRNGVAQTLYPHLSDKFDVIKRGGTKFKQDMEIIDGDSKILISAKKKVKITSGSFDWVNSSSALKDIDALQTFSETVIEVGKTCTSKQTARNKVNNAGQKAIQDLTSSDLTTLLKKHVANKNKGMKIIISETSTNKNWEYDFEDSPLYHSIQNHTPKTQKSRGKTSAKIVFEDDQGNIVDHGIRIRIVTNNGIGALIGQSKTNTGSLAVVKIQQDNVSGLISGLKDKIRKF